MDKLNDLRQREILRRKAIWRLVGLPLGDHAALELVQTLNEIEQAELNDALLATTILDVDGVLAQVPVEHHASTPAIVRAEAIPQPWRDRFLAASIGSTRVSEGFYAHDWRSFLKKWQAEMTHLERHRIAATKEMP